MIETINSNDTNISGSLGSTTKRRIKCKKCKGWGCYKPKNKSKKYQKFLRCSVCNGYGMVYIK